MQAWTGNETIFISMEIYNQNIRMSMNSGRPQDHALDALEQCAYFLLVATLLAYVEIESVGSPLRAFHPLLQLSGKRLG